jgi:cytochrome b561
MDGPTRRRYGAAAQALHWIVAGLLLAWRLKHPPPPLPADMHRVERLLARLTHVS